MENILSCSHLNPIAIIEFQRYALCGMVLAHCIYEFGLRCQHDQRATWSVMITFQPYQVIHFCQFLPRIIGIADIIWCMEHNKTLLICLVKVIFEDPKFQQN